MNVTEAAARYGATPRQVEHWIGRDYLRVTRNGRGHQRTIPEDELPVLAALVRLVAVGFRWDVAAALARHIAAEGNTLRLPGGVHITIHEETP